MKNLKQLLALLLVGAVLVGCGNPSVENNTKGMDTQVEDKTKEPKVELNDETGEVKVDGQVEKSPYGIKVHANSYKPTETKEEIRKANMDFSDLKQLEKFISTYKSHEQIKGDTWMIDMQQTMPDGSVARGYYTDKIEGTATGYRKVQGIYFNADGTIKEIK